MTINFKKFNEKAIIPKFGHDDNGNAGLDFYACFIDKDEAILKAHSSINIDTFIGWEPGMTVYQNMHSDIWNPYPGSWKPAMIIKGRSGLSINNGIECCNAGVIDSGYRGSITIRLYNTSDKDFTILYGDRIAQGVVILIPNIEVQEVKELNPSIRGERGFGSSGK